MNEHEFRAAEAVSVDFPKRMVEVIVTPWEQETSVMHKGRMIREVFTRGAYDGVEQRPNRLKVNLDHDRRRPIGKVVTLHPARDEGLVAELFISESRAGDDALHLAADGILDASAEFSVMDGGETWEGKLRRITKAWLHGVAFTGDPAYPGAQVLAVRESDKPVAVTVATPNRDRIELMLARERAAEIDRRFGIVSR